MRPRRIARRFIARARHWGTPHVHCPSCGGDNPVPEDTWPAPCFVCKVFWFRHELTGDPAADHAAIAERVPDGQSWAAVFHPLLVDSPDGDGGKYTKALDDLAFVYIVPA